MSPECDQHPGAPEGDWSARQEDVEHASHRVFSAVAIAEASDSIQLGRARTALQSADVLVCTVVLAGTITLDVETGSITLHSGEGLLQVGDLTPLQPFDSFRAISVAVRTDLLPMLGPTNDIAAATLHPSELLVVFTRFSTDLLGHDSAGRPSTLLESRCLERAVVQLMRGLTETVCAVPPPRTTRLNSLHRAALAYIASRYVDPALSSVEVARALDVSRRLLFLAFAQHDESYADAVRRFRVKAVKAELLLNPEQPLQGLLLHSGFGSLEALKRSFQVSEQMTVATYRRRRLLEQTSAHQGPSARRISSS